MEFPNKDGRKRYFDGFKKNNPYIEKLLPFALSFAAGAMILVAVHELIPECQNERGSTPYFSTMGIISGFAVMMLLDVMLG